jgi:hypothetical protein
MIKYLENVSEIIGSAYQNWKNISYTNPRGLDYEQKFLNRLL